MNFVYLVLGGAIGTVSRYFLSGAIYRVFGTSFPYGTFVVNIIGCLVVGFLVGFSDKKFFLNDELRVLLIVGFCGAFTTFSTYIFETDNLLKNGEMVKACLNITLSVFIGFLLYRLGFFLSKLI